MSSKMAQFEQTALSLFFFVCMSCFFVMCVFPQSKECLHLGGLVPCGAEYPTQQQATASAIRLSVGATPPTSEQFARRSPPCCGRRIPLSASQSRTQLRNCELWRNNTAFGKAASATLRLLSQKIGEPAAAISAPVICITESGEEHLEHVTYA